MKPALELEHITQQAALTGELIQTVTVLNQVPFPWGARMHTRTVESG